MSNTTIFSSVRCTRCHASVYCPTPAPSLNPAARLRADRLAMIDTLECAIRRRLGGRNLVYRGIGDYRLTLRAEWFPLTRRWDVRIAQNSVTQLNANCAYFTAGLGVGAVDYTGCDSRASRLDAEEFASAEHVDGCARMWARQVVEEICNGR